MAARARSSADYPIEEKVIWQAQARQAAFISCPVFEVFFGGARGGGKTDAVLGDWLEHSDMYGDQAIGLIVRRTHKDLLEAIERSRVLYIPLGWSYNEQKSMWSAPNGARLRFAYLERDSDADHYQGHNYTRVYVEEIGQFPDPKPILKLFATLRSGSGVPVGFRATGNPGGPGHHWVKQRYIDNCPTGWRVHKDSLTGLERVFIPSKVGDNAYLGQDYVERLKAVGSESLVRAWLEGDWSVIDGAFFDCWSMEKHVVAPFAIPAHWLRFRSMDWGFAAPFSIGWWAVVGDDTPAGSLILPKGAMIRYREWYGGGPGGYGVGIRWTAEQIAQGIVGKETTEDIRYGVLDPSAFAEQGGPSFAEQMNKVLIACKRMTWRRADNRKVPDLGAFSGWSQMRTRMVGQEGRPMIYCFSTCVDSIRTIPTLQHDPDKPEDINEGEDHCADEWRYACMSRPWVHKQIEPKPDKTELRYKIDAHGRLQANMTVLEIVQERMRRKKANGY